jgi:hypothetical protein
MNEHCDCVEKLTGETPVPHNQSFQSRWRLRTEHSGCGGAGVLPAILNTNKRLSRSPKCGLRALLVFWVQHHRTAQSFAFAFGSQILFVA